MFVITLSSTVDHEDDDYQCVGVVSVHTQDVKNVSWHPHKEVSIVS